MSVEYFDGVGFGSSDDEPHIHSWMTRPWRTPDLEGMEIYDCGCGVRRIVPIDMHPNSVDDAPVLPFPASCPRQANQI